MSFQLKRRVCVGKSIGRFCRRQIDKALEEAKARDGKDATVHESRKRMKKIRAAIRLVQGELGKKIYQEENKRFRDAARPLTQIRDAKVLLETFEKIRPALARHEHAETLIAWHLSLAMNRHSVRKQVMEEQRAMDSITEVLREARSHTAQWPFRHRGWQAVNVGLEQLYTSGLESFGVAIADPSTEHLHEWRKQAKYLGHALQILEAVQPKILRRIAGRFRRLTTLLGDDHDLAVLRDKIEEIGHATHHRWSGAAEVIQRRREELQEKAFRLGKKLYRFEPGDFVQRMKKYWNAWKSHALIRQVDLR